MPFPLKMNFIALLLFVSACGGGGSSGTSAAGPSTEPRDNFDDEIRFDARIETRNPTILDRIEVPSGFDPDRGIAVFGRQNTGPNMEESRILYMADNITEVTGNTYQISLENKYLSTGTVTVGDADISNFNVTILEENFGLQYLDDNNRSILLVNAGISPTNIPNATYTYEGVSFTSEEQFESNRTSHVHYLGDFQIQVNFANGRALFDSRTSSSANSEGYSGDLVAYGRLDVDVENGTFSGQDVTFHWLEIFKGRRVGGRELPPLTVHGMFHGDGANGVSGVYYNANELGVSSVSGFMLGKKIGLLEFEE